ncbi:MAG: PD-(D/E)XK nuclease family protein [Planctomycetes bacterium]|nr:PD-(D/E)XK nuclease family protein [Planctomycetota bacterium]
MNVKILWNSRDWADAVDKLPAQGPLPCRTVLVPRGRVAHALRRELIRIGRGRALAGTRFVPAPLAAVGVLRAAGFAFDPGEEALRATRLSVLFRSELRLAHFSFELLRSTPGWDEAFARTLSDLEGAGLRPENLEAAGTPERLHDVARIWRALDDSASRSWTVERVYREAAAALEGRSAAWPFQGAVLVFAGGDLTAAEARFLRAIPRATVGLLAARPARKRYLDRMENLLGAAAGTALRTAVAPRASGSERDLLASYLFEPPAILADPKRPRSDRPDGTVDIEEHAGVEAELEATANWVARQVAEGTPLEETAVLVPAQDPLSGLVTERLGRLPWHDGSLPVHVAGGLPLTSFTAGARALAVVRALRARLAAKSLGDVLPALRLVAEAERHLSRGATMHLLWSLGTVGGNPARPEGALEWSARAAERQVELEEQLARAQADENAGDARLARRARGLERIVADLRGVRPALDALVGIARCAIENAGLSVLWPRLRVFLEEWVLQPGAGPRPHVVLDERLCGLAADGTCGSLASDDALRVVEQAILTARVPIGRFGEPAVYVGSVRDAVGLCFSAVRVIGLAEGHLPAVSREDPVIPDVLREGLFVPTAMDRALEDLHALDAVVRNTERRIVLSIARLDVERSQREPSSVILEAAAALARPNRVTGERTALIPDRTALQRDAFAPAREEATRFRMELPLNEAAWHDGVAQGTLGLPQRWRGMRSLDLDRVQRLVHDGAPGAMDGWLGAQVSDITVPGLSSDRPISPSSIEKLLGCPHAFLLEHLLGFEEPATPPPQREIGQPAYGLMFHAVAAEFYTSNGASFSAREGKLSEWVGAADQIVARAFQEFLKGYPLVGDAVRTQQRERLRRDLRELLEYDWEGAKDTRFVAVERIFGQPTPVELRTGGSALHLRGRIDRIDVQRQTSLVRDLKTGRAYFRVGKQTAPDPGVDLQIAVYGLVAGLLADEWKIPKRIAAAYAYFGRGGAAERSFREDFHEALEPPAQKWLDVAARLLAERLFPRTPIPEDCTYCCFRPVCGDAVYDRASALLAGAGGVLADFATLKGGEPDEPEA